MDFTPEEPKRVSPPVHISDIQQFFVDFIKNDNLGIIANAHCAIADASPKGAYDEKCSRLVALHSIAVDFQKTGVPAELPRELKAEAYPHFMENKTKGVYTSQKVLGQMYDRVRDAADNAALNAAAYALTSAGAGTGAAAVGSASATAAPSSAAAAAAAPYDASLLIAGYGAFCIDAIRLRNEYEAELLALMQCYGIRSEAEAFTGHVLRFNAKAHRRKGKKKPEDAREVITRKMQDLRRRYRQRFLCVVRNETEDGAEEGGTQSSASSSSASGAAIAAGIEPAMAEGAAADDFDCASLPGEQCRVALQLASAIYAVTYCPPADVQAAIDEADVSSDDDDESDDGAGGRISASRPRRNDDDDSGVEPQLPLRSLPWLFPDALLLLKAAAVAAAASS